MSKTDNLFLFAKE